MQISKMIDIKLEELPEGSPCTGWKSCCDKEFDPIDPECQDCLRDAMKAMQEGFEKSKS